LNPLVIRRHGWSGTGTTQSASANNSEPASRILAPNLIATVRRPSYFKA
jgi:hypothetical protein